MLLTVVTFLPALGALLVFFLPRGRAELARRTSFGVSAATFLASLPLYLRFDSASAAYQFVEQRAWMPSLGISYHLGVDGISLLLVLLTTFLMPLTLLSAWHAIESRWKEFAITMLLLETGMVCVFVALDLFLFYVFWEAMLVPMYLIIGIWGGSNRVYAAIKFILYTLTGSLLMLVAILALYFRYGAATGTYTFDLPVLAQFVLPGGRAQDLLFLAFALAFAIKVPMFPFHTWLPDAHVDAPTAGSVLPALSALFLIVCLSSLGLPGLNGFVGEFLILLGAFQVDRTLAVFATTGIIFAAVYLLWMYQRVIFGVITNEANRRLPDLSAREWAILLPILLLIVWIGVYPASFTGMTEASVEALITQVQAKAAAPAAALLVPAVV